MKTGNTMAALDGMEQVRTTGDIRRIMSNALLALARKEISATDVEAMAKGLDAISHSLHVEVKTARAQIEMREKSADIGKVTHMGQLMIDSAPPGSQQA
jgi:hypothetical protein